MAKTKIYGTITSVGEVNLEKKLVSFEIREEGIEKNCDFGVVCFERVMQDQESMHNLVVGNKVTVAVWLSSKLKVSTSGSRFFNVNLICDKIENGDTTHITKKVSSNNDPIFIPGGEEVGLNDNNNNNDTSDYPF